MGLDFIFFIVSLGKGVVREPSNCSSTRRASAGVWFPRDECGRTLL